MGQGVGVSSGLDATTHSEASSRGVGGVVAVGEGAGVGGWVGVGTVSTISGCVGRYRTAITTTSETATTAAITAGEGPRRFRRALEKRKPRGPSSIRHSYIRPVGDRSMNALGTGVTDGLRPL